MSQFWYWWKSVWKFETILSLGQSSVSGSDQPWAEHCQPGEKSLSAAVWKSRAGTDQKVPPFFSFSPWPQSLRLKPIFKELWWKRCEHGDNGQSKGSWSSLLYHPRKDDEEKVELWWSWFDATQLDRPYKNVKENMVEWRWWFDKKKPNMWPTRKGRMMIAMIWLNFKIQSPTKRILRKMTVMLWKSGMMRVMILHNTIFNEFFINNKCKLKIEN